MAQRNSFFNGRDMTGWRKPAGEWMAAAKVSPDSADPKKFAIQPGASVLVNGPNGRTVNLISESEHGDVEAHLEFAVPKGSNSGIYFQARYERFRFLIAGALRNRPIPIAAAFMSVG